MSTLKLVFYNPFRMRGLQMLRGIVGKPPVPPAVVAGGMPDGPTLFQASTPSSRFMWVLRFDPLAESYLDFLQ